MALRLSEGLGVTRRLHAGSRCLLLCAQKAALTPVFDFGYEASNDQSRCDDCRSTPIGKTADVTETQTTDRDDTKPDCEMLWR